MKNFFRWFKNHAKMKRWLLVILVGIVALCYGVSELLIVNKTLDTSKIGFIVAAFIVGIALAMDAVGVTVSIGVNPKVIRRNKIAFIMSFAIFQFLFFLLGGIGGHLFEKYIR